MFFSSVFLIPDFELNIQLKWRRKMFACYVTRMRTMNCYMARYMSWMVKEWYTIFVW